MGAHIFSSIQRAAMTAPILQMEISGPTSTTSTPGSHPLTSAHNLLPSPSSLPYHSQHSMQPSDEFYSYMPTSYPPSSSYQSSYQSMDNRYYDNPNYWNESSYGEGAWYSSASCNQESIACSRAPPTYADLSPVETFFFGKNEPKTSDYQESDNVTPCDHIEFAQIQSNEAW